MARPKSQDKRNAIFMAAVELIAEQGLSVPTAKIAQAAGVADGTLFTYFETKERLLSELYVKLKREELSVVLQDYPFNGSMQEQARHFWNACVQLGTSHPGMYRVITLLSLSDRISQSARLFGSEGYEPLAAALQECFRGGALKDCPPEFGTSLMLSIMDSTIDFILHHPAENERFRDAGFTVFWNAITR